MIWSQNAFIFLKIIEERRIIFITSLYLFILATLGSMQDFSSLARDRTGAPCILSMGILTTGLPGKSPGSWVFVLVTYSVVWCLSSSLKKKKTTYDIMSLWCTSSKPGPFHATKDLTIGTYDQKLNNSFSRARKSWHQHTTGQLLLFTLYESKLIILKNSYLFGCPGSQLWQVGSSSPTRVWTWAPCTALGAWSPSHWMTREAPRLIIF